MARWDHLQCDFSLGELSPLMAGRRDSPDFNRGLATCLNAIVGQRGEWVRRPGTKHFHDTVANAPVRLVEMITAEQRPILLEFGNRSVRLTTFIDDQHSTATVETPYSQSDIWQLDWAQSGNSLFLVHADHAPQLLSVDQEGDWHLAPLGFVDGPYLNQNSSPNQKLAVDGAGVWAPPGFTPFSRRDVGRPLRIRTRDGTWHYGIMTGYRNIRRMDVVWHSEGGQNAARNGEIELTFEWQLGAYWSNNFPTSICFHEDRLILAATRSNPQSFWASQSSDYTNFGPSDPSGVVMANNAIFAALNDRQINRIQWLISSQDSLVAGTASGLWIVNGGIGKGAIAPSTVQAQRLSGASSNDVRPTSIDRSTLFVERSGRRLLALRRDTVELIYLTPDISIRSEHLLTSGISAMAYQAVPWATNWCLMQDGSLAGLTMTDGEQTLGWHRHQIAGPDARILSIATLPGVRSDNARKQDSLFMVVERTLSSGKRYSVEMLGDAYEHDTKLSDAEFVDGAVKIKESYSFSRLTGLDHLEGLTVEGLSDGALQTPKPVSGGAVNISPGKTVIMGLPFESRADLMDIDAHGFGAFSDGRPRHLYEVILRLWRSVSVEASLDGRWVEYTGDDPRRLHEPAENVANERHEPYTGGLRIKRDSGGWSRQVKMAWRSKTPMPLVVLSALLRFQDSDG